MKGHIRKQSEHSWAVVVDLPRDPATGKRRQKWITVRGTKRDAQKVLAEVLAELGRGAYAEPSRTTLADYLDQWLEQYAQPSVAPRTYDNYRWNVAHIKRHLGQVPLADLRPAQIQGMYAALLESGLAPKTVHLVHGTLRLALKHAVRWELIPRNPVEQVEPPRVERPEITVLTREQVGLLLEAVRQTRFYIPVLLAVSTGLRRGEVFGLTWDAVDLEARVVKVQRSMIRARDGEPVWGPTKTQRSQRVVTLPEFVAAELAEHRRRQDLYRQLLGPKYRDYGLVVCLEDGRAWDTSNFEHSFRRLMDRLGFKGVRFHDLRHTHATLLLEAGVHPKVVQERLGHSQIAVTMDTYSHVLPTIQREAALVLDQLLGAGRVPNAVPNQIPNERGEIALEAGASGRKLRVLRGPKSLDAVGSERIR